MFRNQYMLRNVHQEFRFLEAFKRVILGEGLDDLVSRSSHRALIHDNSALDLLRDHPLCVSEIGKTRELSGARQLVDWERRREICLLLDGFDAYALIFGKEDEKLLCRIILLLNHESEAITTVWEYIIQSTSARNVQKDNDSHTVHNNNIKKP